MEEAKKHNLDHADIRMFARTLAQQVVQRHNFSSFRLFPVPRGGIPVAYAMMAYLPQGADVVEHPGDADVIIDDLIDSGATKEAFAEKYPDKPFYGLIDKRTDAWKGKWITFPWERTLNGGDESATDIVTRLLQYVGEDPKRDGLKETPQRVLRAWKHWTSGYAKKPEDVVKVFKDGADKYDEMLWENKLPFYSMCEHHLAPFFGDVTIAYIPNGSICGLSKFHRVVDIFARRLQVQERLTVQIADALMELLEPKGVGVVLRARHMCKESRGIAIQGSFTTTSALRGAFLQPEVRAEFLNLAK